MALTEAEKQELKDRLGEAIVSAIAPMLASKAIDSLVDSGDLSSESSSDASAPSAEISASKPLTQELDRLGIYNGMPTEGDLSIIKRLTSNQDWQAADWTMWSYKASDNLLHGDESVWHESLLDQIASNYEGANFMLDHDWDESEAVQGFIVSSQMVTQQKAPQKSMAAGVFEKENKKMMKDTGKPYRCVVMKCAVRSDSAFNQAAMERRAQFCSTGFHLYRRSLICPNCSKEAGRDVTFDEVETIKDSRGRNSYERICSHTAPDPFLRMLIARWGEPGYEMNWADYSIKKGDMKPVELSSVSSPMLPDCQILREAPWRDYTS